MRESAVRPKERIVYDELQPCPYLEGHKARLPIRWPERQLTRSEFEQRLAAGDRRTGPFLYRTSCPGCTACEAIRVPIVDFQPRTTQRRVLRKGNELLSMTVAEPIVDAERVALYNRHKNERGLAQPDQPAHENEESYGAFLVDTCCETLELTYRCQDQLVAVAIVDRGLDSLSAVYTYYDPEFRAVSLGAYSILRQVELCREWNLGWLYLGYYVAECIHMSYKGLYCPHERLIGGSWRRILEPPPRPGMNEGAADDGR